MGSLPVRARIYVLAVVVLAVATVLCQLAILSMARPDLASVLTGLSFAVLIILAELHPVQVSHTTRLSVTASLDYALAVTVGAQLGAPTVALAALVIGWWQTRCNCTWTSAAFNGSNAVIAVAAASATFTTIAGSSTDTPALLFAASASAAVYLLTNLGLVILIVNLSNHQESLRRWLIRWVVALPQYAGLLFLGGVAAWIYHISPFATLLLLVPLCLMYFTLRATMAVRQETINAIEALATQIDQRSPYTAQHSERVERYAEKIATAMGLAANQIDLITRTARIHDVGKIYLPTHILEKEGPLEAWEWEQMRQHPVIGADLVSNFADYRDGKDLILYHHERIDGKGYPFGLRGDDIPLGARILTVADSFDVMTSVRPYKKAMSFDRAVQELDLGAGTQFDPRVVAAFKRAIKPDDVPATALELPVARKTSTHSVPIPS